MTDSEKLDKILGEITVIRTWQDRHDEHHNSVARDIHELREEVYGDGSPGLKARAQTAEDTCKWFRSTHRARAWWAELLLRAAASATGGAVLALLFWLLLLYRYVRVA